METLFEVWKRHENELEKLLDVLNIDIVSQHSIRMMQIKHQREEIRAIQNDK